VPEKILVDPPTPEQVLRCSPEEADRFLDDFERNVPVRAGFADLPNRGFTEAIVFGDTHGDWRSTLEVEKLFLAETGGPRCLVGLGDYIDRHPIDCGQGSVANAFLLLGLAARYPDRVFLVQGNHETTRRIPVMPQTLPEEVDELWGPLVSRYVRLLALLERGPLGAATANGAYFAHAGFPRGPLPASWRSRFDDPDDDHLAEIVWAECDASRNRRGVSGPWGAQDLVGFLDRTALRVFVRGHDPDVIGRPLYGGTCLTLHTTRVYERYGGVLVGRLPLDRPITSVADVRVEHLATEGRSFPPPD
jgi:Calcineurin-like phosphoesterase